MNQRASNVDTIVRRAAFEWLTAQSDLNGGVFLRDQLARGFEMDLGRVRLVGPQGIFKPRQLSLPLSITTVANGPYRDSIGPDQKLHYKYRGTDSQHPDNIGLRELMRRRMPLVYFHALMPGRYFASWPVYVVGDNVKELTFAVQVDDHRVAPWQDTEYADGIADDEAVSARRKYITVLTRRRLHQVAFRERILEAYRNQCALCTLRHRELLEAAHIVPDSEETGEPVITNGIALCNLHHKAYDALFLSIRPDYVVEIRPDVLGEEDGPVLRHALQGMHGKKVEVPRRQAHRPDPNRLEVRHARFLQAAQARRSLI